MSGRSQWNSTPAWTGSPRANRPSGSGSDLALAEAPTPDVLTRGRYIEDYHALEETAHLLAAPATRQAAQLAYRDLLPEALVIRLVAAGRASLGDLCPESPPLAPGLNQTLQVAEVTVQKWLADASGLDHGIHAELSQAVALQNRLECIEEGILGGAAATGRCVPGCRR